MKQHTEACPCCGQGTGHAVFDNGLAGHKCDHCGSDYANSADMRMNIAVRALVEALGYEVRLTVRS